MKAAKSFLGMWIEFRVADLVSSHGFSSLAWGGGLGM